jgi:hypothetical protein
MMEAEVGRFFRSAILVSGVLGMAILAAGADDPPVPPDQGVTTGTDPAGSMPAADSGEQPDADTAADAEAIHPDAVSPFLRRGYAMKPKRLWKALLEELPAAGFPPEETDEDRRTVKTAFVDFDQDQHTHPVADMPPRFGGGYTILQMVKVKTGKVSIEAIVTPIDGGAELKLRARLLVQGLDRKRGIRVLTDRRSSGVIEAGFLARLEEKQGLRRIPD